MASRDTGHNRVPEPPARIKGVMRACAMICVPACDQKLFWDSPRYARTCHRLAAGRNSFIAPRARASQSTVAAGG
jgi:hypothetical protein